MSNMIPGPGIGGVYSGMEDDWKGQSFRSKVVTQIEDEVHRTGNPTTKSSMEMENHVFQKAKSREEYLALVARLMIHMRDINSRKEGAQGKMQQMGGGAQDPMAALQGLTSMPGSRPGQQGTPPPGQQQMQQMMGARQQHGTAAGQLTMQQRQKQIQMQLQKQLSGASGSPQSQPGFMPGTTQQGMNQPAGGANMGQQMGTIAAGQQGQMIRGQQPFKNRKQISSDGMSRMQPQQMPQQLQQLPQGPGGRGQQGFKTFQQQQQQLQQQQIQQQQLQQQQLQQQQLQQQQLQQQQIQQQQQMQQQQRQQQNPQQRPPASPYGGYAYMMSPQAPPMSPFGSGGQPFVMSPQGPPSSPYGGQQHILMSPQSVTQQPSPASQPQSQGSQPMPSPASYLQPSPSPQQASSMPSPAGSQRGPPSVPSPSGPLSTPGNPGSVGPGSVGSIGPVPSPGKAQAIGQGFDQQAYAEKRKQLSKYIEPLKKMILKASKEDECRKDVSLSKMNSLLDILSDPNKVAPLSMLLKCEQVLERMGLGKGTAQSTTSSTTTSTVTTAPSSAAKPKNICSPLFDAIMYSVKSPTLNHSLQRTFGPGITAIHGPPTNYPTSTPPAKRQKTESDSQGFAVPNIIQGEVARLASKFKISLDDTYHPGGNDIHLICRLEDKKLPSVPPIAVTVPHSYPDASPQCDTTTQEYNHTPFLLSVQRTLLSQIKRMPDRFSLTQMLDIWEMCIRKSCLNTISA